MNFQNFSPNYGITSYPTTLTTVPNTVETGRSVGTLISIILSVEINVTTLVFPSYDADHNRIV